MVITRKIQIYVNEDDADLRKEYLHTLFAWRDASIRMANTIISHKFVQQNVRDFTYIKDEIQDKFYIKDIIRDGKGMSENNVTYRLCSDMYKGKIPSYIYSIINKRIVDMFKSDALDVANGKKSLRSFKKNIRVPLAKVYLGPSLKVNEDGKYIFMIYGIPMAINYGRDRSNNKSIVDKCMSGEYKLLDSDYYIDDRKKKIFLLLCVDMPVKEYKPVKNKTLFAFIGVESPITYCVDINAKNEYDSGRKVFTIGTKEEFLYRRRQIQEAAKRLSEANRYTKGGKGRKKKCKSSDRMHEKEKNYIATKIHTYSRMLVDAAVKNKCERIVLMKQKEREEEAKEDMYVLRNWSFYNLKDKIEQKCKMEGVELKIE